MKRLAHSIIAVWLLGNIGASVAQDRSITVASTTSTEQSGLFNFLLPRFSEKTGIRVSSATAAFISRGDRSGTHEAELRLWKAAGVNIASAKGDWYREIGQGMGPALNMASASNAYLLSDRGTWLSFKNRGDLTILTEGDKRLFNQYGVMVVNPVKHPNVKVDESKAFVDWLISPVGQKAIADYRVGGEQLFFPNAAH
jgi:tungstate transport system substrate-binding protein